MFKFKFVVKPEYLTKDVYNSIKNEVSKKMLNQITRQGIIERIDSVKIGELCISKINGEITTEIEINGSIWKPKKGDAYPGIVSVITCNGIMCKINQNELTMNVFIPSHKLENYTYIENSKVFKQRSSHSEQNSEIMPETKLNILIEDINYDFEKNLFRCIGKIK